MDADTGVALTNTTLNVVMVPGAWYVAVFGATGTAMVSQVVPGNQVSLAFQLPQYVIITSGEILFSVTGLEFAYSQAPRSMKAVLQAAWLLTTAVGQLVVIIVAETELIPDRATEFFFFASFVGVTSFTFLFMARAYTYADFDSEASSDLSDLIPGGSDDGSLRDDGYLSPLFGHVKASGGSGHSSSTDDDNMGQVRHYTKPLLLPAKSTLLEG